MKRFFLIALAIISLDTNAQATDSLPEVQRTIKVTDPFYREDQFYIGLTHSILLQDLPGFSQQSLALGSSFGFLGIFLSTNNVQWQLHPDLVLQCTTFVIIWH